MCEQCSHLSRRFLLGAVAASLVTAAAGPPPPNAISGDKALRRITAGNARYVANKVHMRDFAVGRAARAQVQHPIASILGCADSRVPPEFVFDQGPGELFVVRVAGNILEEEGLASLEYGAQFLGVPLIFVLGHSNCGAVSAAIKVVQDNATLPGHLPGLINQIKPAVLAAENTHPANLLDAAIVENVRQTMQHVTAATPLLSDMIAAGKVKVAGGVYDIATGRVGMI
jgi:carbonic anhydrase